MKKTVFEMTDLEINKLFESILNDDKETKRKARARKAKDVIVMSNARNAAANLKVFFIVPPGKMIFAIDK